LFLCTAAQESVVSLHPSVIDTILDDNSFQPLAATYEEYILSGTYIFPYLSATVLYPPIGVDEKQVLFCKEIIELANK
jgi:hypothetical protein